MTPEQLAALDLSGAVTKKSRLYFTPSPEVK